MSSRRRPLSSQPSRKWADDDTMDHDPDQWSAKDWPTSPPKSPNAVSKPFVPARSLSAATAYGDANPLKQKSKNLPSSKSSSKGTDVKVKPPTSEDDDEPGTSTLKGPSAKTGSSSGSKKKRVLPWEQTQDIKPPAKKMTLDPRDGSMRRSASPAPTEGSTSNDKGKQPAGEFLNILQKVALSAEQQRVHEIVVEGGKNVFFTGSAGTGKSVLLKEIIKSLKRKYPRNNQVAVTASTGMAACNIGGQTLHSFAGIGLGQEPAEQLMAKVQKNRVSSQKWKDVKVLIIDEVSMVDGQLFDKLAYIACRFGAGVKGRKNADRFGGIQLIVTGDFYQLPPVDKSNNAARKDLFAFQSRAWKQCIDHTVNLRKVFRQKDQTFIDMLNELRFGNVSEKSERVWQALKRDVKYRDGIEPTELFALRGQVEKSNNVRLAALPGPEFKYKAIDFSVTDKYAKDGQPAKNPYAEGFRAPSNLTLKVGAQVMLVKNVTETLVNGTIGTVVRFGPDPELEARMAAELRGVKFDEDGKEIEQKPAWQYEEGAVVDVKPAMMMEDDGDSDYGLSVARAERERSTTPAPIIRPDAPLVRWIVPGGHEELFMSPVEFKVEDPKGEILASRKQLPMILSWAMSIHKSQGQTLPRVRVDLGKVFEAGQSYVALSRATSLQSLQVLGFDVKKVQAHPAVKEWSKTLEHL